jgi:hypothetical protein
MPVYAGNPSKNSLVYLSTPLAIRQVSYRDSDKKETEP